MARPFLMVTEPSQHLHQLLLMNRGYDKGRDSHERQQVERSGGLKAVSKCLRTGVRNYHSIFFFFF
jgi:hypothetical protein